MGFGSVVVGAAFAFLFVGFAALLHPWRLADIGWSWACGRGLLRARRFHLLLVASRLAPDPLALGQSCAAITRASTTICRRLCVSPGPGAFTPGLLFKAPLLLIGFPLRDDRLRRRGRISSISSGFTPKPSIGCRGRSNGFSTRRRITACITPPMRAISIPTMRVSSSSGIRMFGSFVAEDAADPPRYGIVKNLKTFNPLMVAFHEWIAIVADLAQRAQLARTGRLLLGAARLVAGWQPRNLRRHQGALGGLAQRREARGCARRIGRRAGWIPSICRAPFYNFSQPRHRALHAVEV